MKICHRVLGLALSLAFSPLLAQSGPGAGASSGAGSGSGAGANASVWSKAGEEAGEAASALGSATAESATQGWDATQGLARQGWEKAKDYNNSVPAIVLLAAWAYRHGGKGLPPCQSLGTEHTRLASPHADGGGWRSVATVRRRRHRDAGIASGGGNRSERLLPAISNKQPADAPARVSPAIFNKTS